jgi:hypothetical protein
LLARLVGLGLEPGGELGGMAVELARALSCRIGRCGGVGTQIAPDRVPGDAQASGDLCEYIKPGNAKRNLRRRKIISLRRQFFIADDNASLTTSIEMGMRFAGILRISLSSIRRRIDAVS